VIRSRRKFPRNSWNGFSWGNFESWGGDDSSRCDLCGSS